MNETLKRLFSGLIYVILLITSILYSLESFFLLFGLFLIIAVFEFCSLAKLKIWFPLALAVLFFGLFYFIPFSILNDNLLLLVTLLVSIKCIFFLFNNNFKPLDRTSKYTYLIGYVILPFIIITKIPIGINAYNPKIIISIFILIWTNDTFAYIFGKSVGKHKLFEKISPKKTIEGFIGGIIFSIIAAYLVSKYYIEANPQYFEKSLFIWIIIALIAGVFGTLGDLVESKFKRIANVKDSGSIMPGHGGVLDRLDSIIFVAPFVYLFYKILYYVTLS